MIESGARPTSVRIKLRVKLRWVDSIHFGLFRMIVDVNFGDV